MILKGYEQRMKRLGGQPTWYMLESARADNERLSRELGETNEALAACQLEGQKWKRVAVDMAVLILRLVRALSTVSYNADLQTKALDFLDRHGLGCDPLRALKTADKPAEGA